MNRSDLENALKDNTITYSSVKSTILSNIMQYVDVELKIEKYSLDYYYEIDVQSLLNSKMPINDLDDLKEEGWSFNENKEKIILFLKV